MVNNTYEPQDTTVYTTDGSSFALHLDANEIMWNEIYVLLFKTNHNGRLCYLSRPLCLLYLPITQPVSIERCNGDGWKRRNSVMRAQ